MSRDKLLAARQSRYRWEFILRLQNQLLAVAATHARLDVLQGQSGGDSKVARRFEREYEVAAGKMEGMIAREVTRTQVEVLQSELQRRMATSGSLAVPSQEQS